MMGRNADREMRTRLETRGEGRGGGGRGGVEEMGEGQTFYSGISNGGAKSLCNFLSAGRIHPRGLHSRGGRERVHTARRSPRGHVIGRKRQKYAPIGRSSG